jgi:hypothetical protein
MDDAHANRLAGWAGVVFSVLSLIVLPLLGPGIPPVVGSSGEAFVNYFGEHRLGFLVGNYLGIAAFFPGFVQLVIVANRFRRAEGPEGWFAPLILTTGTFGYAVFGCSLAMFQVLPFLATPGTTQEAHAMGTLASVWFALDGLAGLPLVVAVGWASRATSVLPPWFARFSTVTAVILLVMSVGGLTSNPAWLAGGGFVTAAGFVAFFVWTLVLAIVFLKKKKT